MKVKCSGAQPCARCGRKNERCVYETEEKKVTVTERRVGSLFHSLWSWLIGCRSYLRALERRQDGPSPGGLRSGGGVRPRHSSVSDYGMTGVLPRDTSVAEADGGMWPRSRSVDY